MTRFHRRPDGRVLRIGHRGAAALAPENTIDSFETAVGCGADFVEFDVVALADGTLVVAHSLREVAPKPATLDDALAFFAGEPDVGVHVDVKCRGRSADVAAAVLRHGLTGRAVASSSHFRTLHELRAAIPELAVGVTYPDDRFGIARRRGAGPFIAQTVAALARVLPRRLPRWLRATDARVVLLHYGVVTPAAIARCRAAGAAVWAWTVNDRPLVDELVALGVDGIVSDDPRLLH